MTEEIDLIPGRFYWVKIAYDPDTNNKWENEDQPARFSHKNKDGILIWNYLNINDNNEWPVIWIGNEIKKE